MKKILALFVALMMLFSVTALAEAPVYVEDLYEGTWVAFVDDGFEMYVPSEWLQVELTDDVIASGTYYAVVSPDETCALTVSWSALHTTTDTATLATMFNMMYPGAEAMVIGDYEAVCYVDTENDTLGFAILDATEPGMYLFNFAPASNQDIVALATAIMASIRDIAQ